jgi:hypothetical protein
MVNVIVKILGLEGSAVHRRFLLAFRGSFSLSLLSNLMLAKVTRDEEKSWEFGIFRFYFLPDA